MRFYTLLLASLFLLLPLTAYADSSEPPIISDGSVVQAKGSSRIYYVVNGKKLRVADQFTLRELGFKPKNIVRVGKKELSELPEGEVLKISKPRVSGMFDMHEHFRKDGNMELYLETAAKLGVEKAIFVPTGMNPDNSGYKDHMAALLQEQKKHPDRVIAFCTVDEADTQAPGIFEKCLDEGGKGLKLLGGHPEFYDTPLNNDVVKQLFTIARDRDVPVIVHVSIITLPQAKEELKSLLDEFPEVRLQFAHYCSTVYNGINLDQCAEFLDRYPNLYIDLSMGGGIPRYFKYMSEEGGLKKIKDFLLKYQDRILYGTDIIVAPTGPTKNKKWVSGRMMCDFSLHQEKFYRCPTMNKKGEYILLPGFEFSEEILRKLYIENPKKFLKIQ